MIRLPLLFIAEGAKVGIIGRNHEGLEPAAAQFGNEGIACEAGIFDGPAVERAILATVSRSGKLDILFANAGSSDPTPVALSAVEVLERVLKDNVTATFFLVQAAMPYLNRGASIIFNGSVQAVNGALSRIGTFSSRYKGQSRFSRSDPYPPCGATWPPIRQHQSRFMSE